jgi:Flp pilus assembly protein CpaB
MRKLREWMTDRRAPLLAGVVCALVALLLYDRERRAWMAQAGEGVQVGYVRVRRTVEAGAALDAGALEAASMPRRFAHPQAVDGGHAALAAGLRAARPLSPGQPLLWSDLEDPNAGQAAALVRPLERAVVLRAPGGDALLRPSDHVDVFGTFERPGGEVVTVPVLQNVLVLAAGAAGLTVSVSPHEAALLTLAQETGRMAYVLRNRFDRETAAELAAVRLDDLFEDGRRAAVQTSHNIRVLKGKL